MHTGSDIELGSISVMNNSITTRNSDDAYSARLNSRVVLKLDLILLPFLSLLFLLNALDKSNIGNAESGHFTQDLGLPESALNVSVAWFFAVFVTLQPVGAFFGRRYGMVRWVPACMSLWGLCTALHVAVRSQSQLVALRVMIAALEAGFYPTTVSYLSLWYTRYEFGKRLAFFYGQSALAGCFGGLLSWTVFKYFPSEGHPHASNSSGWRSWEILFLTEGVITMFVASVGFFWLPHSASTAWFLTPAERAFAEDRIRRDCVATSVTSSKHRSDLDAGEGSPSADQDEIDRLLPQGDDFQQSPRGASCVNTTSVAASVTADAGVTREDVFSAFFDWKVWYLLICNILSAIPATAFTIFLPLVIKGLAGGGDMLPATANLLAIPPFFAGAVVLWVITWWSDRKKVRLIPILYGLAILLAGLAATISIHHHSYELRYIALIILLSGSFVASPLTVTWLSNNIPEPGKRAIVLGINGWGNFAGVLSSLLFAPRFAKDGYIIPFYFTLVSVLGAFIGYLAFRSFIVAENRRRSRILSELDDEDIQREAAHGDVTIPQQQDVWSGVKRACKVDSFRQWIKVDSLRRGDEKLTFVYSL